MFNKKLDHIINKPKAILPSMKVTPIWVEYSRIEDFKSKTEKYKDYLGAIIVTTTGRYTSLLFT